MPTVTHLGNCEIYRISSAATVGHFTVPTREELVAQLRSENGGFLEVHIERRQDASFNINRPERVAFYGNHIRHDPVGILEPDRLGQRGFPFLSFFSLQFLEVLDRLKFQRSTQNVSLI